MKMKKNVVKTFTWSILDISDDELSIIRSALNRYASVRPNVHPRVSSADQRTARELSVQISDLRNSIEDPDDEIEEPDDRIEPVMR